MAKKKKQSTAFEAHLETNEISAERAAKELDITKSYIRGLATGAQTPGLKLAIKISVWSGGAVPVESWVRR